MNDPNLFLAYMSGWRAGAESFGVSGLDALRCPFDLDTDPERANAWAYGTIDGESMHRAAHDYAFKRYTLNVK